MKQIHEALKINDFSKKIISKASREQRPKQKTDKDRPQGKAFLPYVKGTTDKIGRILHQHNIETIFKTCQKVKSVLRNPKHKIPLEAQGVYEIPCESCQKVYIGQTNRRVAIRKEEHMNAVAKNESTSSLAQHVKATGHKIDFDNTRILANVEHYKTRVVREAIEIEKHPQNLNKRDDAQRLPESWKPALSANPIKKKEHFKAPVIQPVRAKKKENVERISHSPQPVRILRPRTQPCSIESQPVQIKEPQPIRTLRPRTQPCVTTTQLCEKITDRERRGPVTRSQSSAPRQTVQKERPKTRKTSPHRTSRRIT